MALARHDDLGGNFHFDWFLGRVEECADDDARIVRTFRCQSRIDHSLATDGALLEQLDDHRWFYLYLSQTHQLSQGRGVVTPLARGWWRSIETTDESVDEAIELRWDSDKAIRKYRITLQPESRLFTLE
ncbi:MAG: hypothetical protein O2875_00765 [Planctomycetota bacterium]|nr:hypothetical protein [Planctomycetota bacterium]MDA1262642.1 hypothetical protein [Planctomycetota bacterium]